MIKKSLSVIFIAVLLLSMNMHCYAKGIESTEQEYIDNVIQMAIQNGDIKANQIVTSKVVISESENNGKVKSFSTNKDTCEGVMVITHDGEEYMSNYIIPYVIVDNDLVNVTRANGTSIDSDFETPASSNLYLKITAKYIYYSSADTQYYGPFFRPTSFTVKWSNGSASCSVSSLEAVYSSRAQVWNMNTLTATSRTEGYISSLSKSNPTKNMTYWGSAINMNSDEALALIFNGIDTYSYINVSFNYSVNGSAYKSGEVGCNVFLDSGLTD